MCKIKIIIEKVLTFVYFYSIFVRKNMPVIKPKKDNSKSPFKLSSGVRKRYKMPKYHHSVGVFKASNKMWCVRIRNENNIPVLLSYHKTEEEANLIYDLYLRSKSE